MSARAPDDMPSILDGRLVRLLDGEVTAKERRELQDLLSTSPETRERYAYLQSLSARLSEELGRETFAPPPALKLPERAAPDRSARRRGSVPTGWRVAAAVALLLGAGLTVAPVRAFLATGATRLLNVLAPQEPGTVQAEPTPVAGGPSTVSFVPEGRVFVVSVASLQASGSLRIAAVEDRIEVAASVLEGDGESLVVLPSELRVANTPNSTADYRVEVPRSLSRVEVRIEGATVVTITPAEAPGLWEIPLGR